MPKSQGFYSFYFLLYSTHVQASQIFSSITKNTKLIKLQILSKNVSIILYFIVAVGTTELGSFCLV